MINSINAPSQRISAPALMKRAPSLVNLSPRPFVVAPAPDQRLGLRLFLLVMLLARLALGGLLIYAGAVKLSDTAAFAEAIANFDILPPSGDWIAALTLPWIEIVIGSLLICGLYLRYSALATALMFLGFGAAVLWALARGLDIECGCFGTDDYARVGWQVLAIEGAVIALAVVVAIFPSHSLALSRLPRQAVRVHGKKQALA